MQGERALPVDSPGFAAMETLSYASLWGKEERKALTSKRAATSDGVLITLQNEASSVQRTQSDTVALDCFVLFPHSLHVQLDPAGCTGAFNQTDSTQKVLNVYSWLI